MPAHEPALDVCALAGLDDAVEPLALRFGDRDEHRVGRGRRASSRCRRAPETTGTPWMRRRWKRGIVVDEADDADARRLAQLAQEAPPAPAGADDERALLRAAPDDEPSACATPRSQKREAPISSTQMSASITKTPRGKSRDRGSPRGSERRDLETTTAAKMVAASRAPA